MSIVYLDPWHLSSVDLQCTSDHVRTSRHLQSRCGLHEWLCTDMESITISLLLQLAAFVFVNWKQLKGFAYRLIAASALSAFPLTRVFYLFWFLVFFVLPSFFPVLFCSFLCFELTFSFFLLCASIFGLEKLISLLFKVWETYREQRNRAREMVLILISVN